MEQLNKIALTQQPTGSGLLRTTSALQLSEGMALVEMMAQAQAFKPNQALPPGTPDLYLQAWEEISQQYGMERFRAGLWRALRDTAFFPAPSEIEASCEVLNREADTAKREEREANEKAKWEQYKSACRKEMEEDSSNPEAWEEQIAASAQKLGLGRKKVIDRSEEIANCPHCQKELPVARNIRFWSSKELYEMAAVKEQSELIAERNRSMPRLPLGDVVDEVTA